MAIKLTIQAEEIIEKKVMKFGQGAHVIVPKKWLGKKVKIVRLE